MDVDAETSNLLSTLSCTLLMNSHQFPPLTRGSLHVRYNIYLYYSTRRTEILRERHVSCLHHDGVNRNYMAHDRNHVWICEHCYKDFGYIKDKKCIDHMGDYCPLKKVSATDLHRDHCTA